MLQEKIKQKEQSGLDYLLEKAACERRGGLSYAGDVEARDAYGFMQNNPCFLIDVRTQPEWKFVGLADLDATKSKLLTVSWKLYPDFNENPNFAENVASSVSDKQTPLFFLCRSGGRSLDAAVRMHALGHRFCFNISNGFEGEPDANGHRGVAAGWKAAGLPWKQG